VNQAEHASGRDVPAIGDEVTGSITAIFSPDARHRSPRIRCDIGLPDWTCNAQFRAEVAEKRDLLRLGDELRGWVIHKSIRERFIAISISDFGRYPPKPDTLAQYINAISMLVAGISRPAEAPDHIPSPECLSTVRGLLTRCVTKDQWDWFLVYRAFGFEDDVQAFNIRRDFLRYQGAAKAFIKGRFKASSVRNAAVLLVERGLYGHLQRALAALAREQRDWQAAKTATPSRVSTVHVKPGAPSPPAFSASRVPRLPDISLAEQIAARVKVERASVVHDLLVRTMSARLSSNDLQPFYNDLIDLYCTIDGTTFIFEMKSTTDKNQLSQVRSAVSQLYEYRFLHNMDGATLVVVLDKPPHEPWVIEYLLEDRAMLLCWLSGDHFECPATVTISSLPFCERAGDTKGDAHDGVG